MSTAGLLSGIGAILIISLIYVSRIKVAGFSKRRTIIFATLGAIFLVIGISLMVNNPEILLSIAIAFLLFGVVCLMLAEVYRTMRKFRDK